MVLWNMIKPMSHAKHHHSKLALVDIRHHLCRSKSCPLANGPLQMCMIQWLACGICQKVAAEKRVSASRCKEVNEC